MTRHKRSAHNTAADDGEVGEQDNIKNNNITQDVVYHIVTEEKLKIQNNSCYANDIRKSFEKYYASAISARYLVGRS